MCNCIENYSIRFNYKLILAEKANGFSNIKRELFSFNFFKRNIENILKGISN